MENKFDEYFILRLKYFLEFSGPWAMSKIHHIHIINIIAFSGERTSEILNVTGWALCATLRYLIIFPSLLPVYCL